MNLTLLRDNDSSKAHNWGKFFVESAFWGETLEDPDRKLESGGEKIDGDTAIPRGRYRISLTFSQRFQKLMPLVFDVPGFSGVRIHGGNTESDTHGCPLLGQYRTPDGVANCAGINDRLRNLLLVAKQQGEDVWLEVK